MLKYFSFIGCPACFLELFLNAIPIHLFLSFSYVKTKHSEEMVVPDVININIGVNRIEKFFRKKGQPNLRRSI